MIILWNILQVVLKQKQKNAAILTIQWIPTPQKKNRAIEQTIETEG